MLIIDEAGPSSPTNSYVFKKKGNMNNGNKVSMWDGIEVGS